MKKLQDVGTFLICLTIATAIVMTVNYRENAYEETNTVSDNNSSVSTTELNEETKEEDELDEEVKRNTIANVNVAWMFHEYLKASENVCRTAEVLLEEYGSKEPKDISGSEQDSKEDNKEVKVVNEEKIEEVKPEPAPSPEPTPIVATYSVSSGDAASRESLGITGKIYEAFGQDELELFFRIVQAEIGDEHTFEQKVNVATVILNRVNSQYFPNSLYDVLTARRQFSTYSSGRYKRVTVSDITILACEYAYEIGGSEVGNALFFDSNGVLKYKKICNDGAHNFYIKSSWE